MFPLPYNTHLQVAWLSGSAHSRTSSSPNPDNRGSYSPETRQVPCPRFIATTAIYEFVAVWVPGFFSLGESCAQPPPLCVSQTRIVREFFFISRAVDDVRAHFSLSPSTLGPKQSHSPFKKTPISLAHTLIANLSAMVSFSKLGALFPAALFALQANAQSGTGVTTRYWDCCKPSCAWSGKASVSSPVRTCGSNQQVLGPDVKSGCDGGSAFTCADNQPWAVSNSLAYGFAAANIAGSSESSWCCQCYQLTFTSGPATGKVMVVQVTNTGGDLGNNHFDILMPGGGVGLFNGCNAQYGSWNGGAQYGGVSSKSQCANLPSIVQPGCNWRFDWFSGSDNPTVNWQAVQCPSALTNISGCRRNSEAGGQPTTGSGQSTTSSRSSSSSSSRSSSTSSSSTRTSSANGSGQTLYGQCGGQGYNGPTTCASGTCKYSNQWYSQCLP